METPDQLYKGELIGQVADLDEELALLTLTHDLVGQHVVKRIFKKLIIILVEICFYGLFILTIVGLVALQSYVPLQFDRILSESATLRQTIIIDEVEAILFITKTMLFLFGIFNLVLGLVFRKLRRKNNKLQDTADIFNSLIELARNRLDRIKRLGI